MSFKPVKYVIFDMDGLLLDTEMVYKQIFEEISSEYGKTYDDHIRVKVLGTVPDDSARIIIEEVGLPLSISEFRAKTCGKIQDKMRNTPFMPGAERLVDHLVSHGIPIAIATSSERDLFEMKMEDKQEFLNKFHHYVVGSEDPEVKSGKPAPDIYKVAASRFPAVPSECLAFEDAPNGVLAAISAGMQCIMVPEDIIPEERTKEATLVLKSLNDFKPELFGLPAFEP